MESENPEPVVIRAGGNLDHAKFLIQAKQLCAALEHSVIVEFTIHAIPAYSISHIFDYDSKLHIARIALVTVTAMSSVPALP